MTIDARPSDDAMPGAAAGQRTASIEHDIGPAGRFSLSVPTGEIEIHAVDGGVARVRDVGQHEPVLRAEPGPGSLRVTLADRGHGRWWHHLPAPILEIELPRGAQVEIVTATADLRTDGLVGDQHVRSVSGLVHLERGGGTVVVENVSGDVDVAAPGALAVRVQTVSGEATVRAATLSRLEIRTMSGDVRAEGRLLPGTHRVETVSGDAVLVGGTDLTAEATTISGDITSDLPHVSGGGLGRRSMRLGDGAAKLVFKSMSGDLAILRGDPAPADPPPPAKGDHESAHLQILEALEVGTIDVAEATRRLAELERG